MATFDEIMSRLSGYTGNTAQKLSQYRNDWNWLPPDNPMPMPLSDYGLAGWIYDHQIPH